MARLLRWSDDLCDSDVAAIERFLGPRLRYLQDAYAPETEEHRAATSLANLLSEIAPMLRSYVAARSLPPFGTPAEQTANAERLSSAVLLHWNWLVCVAEPWRSEPDFDQER